MVTLESLVAQARERGASDLHLEPGLPPTVRVRGALQALGAAVTVEDTHELARGLLADDWEGFTERRSADLARTVSGVRCRINVLHSHRGVGLAVRLLSSFVPTVTGLNLHPDIRKLVEAQQGLVIVTGPTGSGKTSTLVALLAELNTTTARHVITLEAPIEYLLRSQQCFIRQREVGRDTPDYTQGLRDALREDPDVLVVGEMRDAQTMRLTLDAAETGHLVLATMHSSTGAEALQRLVGSFPADLQSAVCAQLADALVAVVAQRLVYRPEAGTRVPECEFMLATQPVRAIIRSGQFYKLGSALESGGAEGQWPFARYRDWLDKRTTWSAPGRDGASAVSDEQGSSPAHAPAAARAPIPAPRPGESRGPLPPARAPQLAPPQAVTNRRSPARAPAGPPTDGAPVLVLDEEVGDPGDILRDLEKRRR